MPFSEYFEEHEEQAFIAKALATALVIILLKNFLAGIIPLLIFVFPVFFLLLIRMHAATTGVTTWELLKEHITFFPMMRSEGERRTDVTPWVTYSIIFLNVAIFYGFEMNAPPEVIDNLVFLPQKPDAFNVPLSAFTSIFLHASGGHLWGNMMFLWVVGTAVERRVGWWKFSWLYLLTGLIAGLAYLLVEFIFNGRAGHILGASGAIAGIMGVFAVRCYFKSMIFPLPILGIFSLILPISLKIRLNSLAIMALFFLSDLSGGISQITGESKSMIGHWAHLGGMISGMLIAGILLKLGEDAVEERHLEIGLKASEAGVGYEGGERSLQIALDRSPDNIDALLGMARIKTKVTNGPEGKGLYEKALRLMMTARQAEVVEVFREYVRKYRAVPPAPALVSRLAEMLRKAGEIELCIHCLERLVEMPEAPRQVRENALFQLATLLEFTSCFDASRSCFARFVAEYPTSILADKAREKAGDEVHTQGRTVPKIVEVSVAKLCPTCGAQMAVRRATGGANQGKSFWVCGAYPTCRTFLPATEPAEEAEHQAPAAEQLPERYRIVFDGSIAMTSDPEKTKGNLARLFKCDRDRIDQMFRGKAIVLKKDLDHASAMKLQEAFNRTGAICKLEAEQVPLPRTAQPPLHAAPQAVPQAPTPQPPAFECPKCGFAQEKGESCVRCGVFFAKLASRAEQDFHSFRDHLPGGAARPVMSESDEKSYAMLCHLMVFSGILIPLGNILGPLAIWLWKRKKSEFIDYHGKSALNYQITVFFFVIGSTVVVALTGVFVLLGPIFGFLGFYSLYAVISSAIKANRGDYSEIALSAHLIK